jgi:hypothetical protein
MILERVQNHLQASLKDPGPEIGELGNTRYVQGERNEWLGKKDDEILLTL